MTKIAVIGTGAMGSVYAGLLAAAGNEVWAIDKWPEHVEAIQRHGLRVEGASGDRIVRVAASVRAEDAGRCELIVIATKAGDVGDAAASAARLLDSSSIVLAIQNGLGSVDRIAEVLGTEQLLVGIVGGFGASIRAPGHVYHHGWELLHIGELSGPATPRVHAVVDLWREAGFPAKAYDDVARMVWEKLICNVCYSGVCTLTGMTIGEVMTDRDAWRVASECAKEAWIVARALGIAVDVDDPVAYVRGFGEKIHNARPSMLLDHLAGRASEIDVINGAIPVQAARAGIRAPYNEVVTALVRQRERKLLLRDETDKGHTSSPSPSDRSAHRE